MAINTDIYNLSDVVLDVQKRFFNETDESTLALSLNGQINALFTKTMQMNIQVESEVANEVFPSKARFEKSIIRHAYANSVSNIEAIPATITIQLALNEEDIEKTLKLQTDSNSFILDKDFKFYIGEFEFHLDYDMIITKQKLTNGTSVYTALYDMSVENGLSDISNPNLPSPYVIPKDGKTFVFIQCILRQVEQTSHFKKVLTNNIIENKTLEFEFENQLAGFDVFVTEDSIVTKLTPIFESSPLELERYCVFSYVNSNRIRIMFDNDSYMPKLNAEITVAVKTTQGSKGNFPYLSSVTGTISSTERFEYDSLEYFFIPATNSAGGRDKRTIAELRKIVPKEALSRGAMVTDTDLNNYFNSLNSAENKVKFFPKINNQIMRSYYCYLVLKKNAAGNMIPTNTISLRIKESEFDSITDPAAPETKTLILKQGCKIGYKQEGANWVGIILQNGTSEFNAAEAANCKFIYTIPFKIAIGFAGPYMYYYMNVINTSYILAFSHINMNAPLQFISTNAFWERGYVQNSNKYILRVKLMQNTLTDLDIVDYTKDADGIVTVTNTTLKVVALFYNANKEPYRYLVGTIESYDPANFISTFKFELLTSDIISSDNQVRIDNLNILKSDTSDYAYLPQTCDVDIFVLNKFVEGEFGLEGISDYVPSTVTNTYTTTNKYSIIGGISMFENFSDIVSSTVTIEEATDRVYHIANAPVLGYDFAKTEGSVSYMVNKLKERKAQIDECLKLINYQFSIDFKLYNTYGPGKLFTVDLAGTKLSKVNLSMEFNISLKKASDDYTKDYIIRDIKEIIEDIDNATDVHFPNLVSTIFMKYANSINYIEFIGINGENITNRHQHIYYNTASDLADIPECLCIATKADGLPDITINTV